MRVRWLLTVFLFTGCMFQHLSASERLRETVLSLDEEARWDRLSLAAERVDPRYRTKFLASRQQWGSKIQIADTEVKSIKLGNGQGAASSLVSVQWYRLDTMELRQTVLKQTWKQRGGGRFALSSERVVAGDSALLGGN